MVLINTTSDAHLVVCLEEAHCPIPQFDFPHRYVGYKSSTRGEVASKLQDATIAITTIIPITPEDLDKCPKLKCVYVMATGVEWVDKDEFKRRGVTVIRAPQSNISAVSEHAIGLYFAARRRIVDIHNRTMRDDEYARVGTLTHHFKGYPNTASMETMAIIGYGFLGKRIAEIARALGMTVLVAERKGTNTIRPERTAFETCLERATVLVIAATKNADTINLISANEFADMRQDAVLINVARGGIVNEKDLVDALRLGRIAGAATDVFEVEPPVRGVSPLLDESIPNLTVSAHVAWYSAETIKNLQDLLVQGLTGYVNGRPVNVYI